MHEEECRKGYRTLPARLGLLVILGLGSFIRRTMVKATMQSSPATRQCGACGERRYSSSFLTSALDGGEWTASRPGRALPRGMDSWYPLYRRLGWPRSRSGHRLEEKSARDRTPSIGCLLKQFKLPVTWLFWHWQRVKTHWKSMGAKETMFFTKLIVDVVVYPRSQTKFLFCPSDMTIFRLSYILFKPL
jgi:hypothetical protein